MSRLKSVLVINDGQENRRFLAEVQSLENGEPVFGFAARATVRHAWSAADHASTYDAPEVSWSALGGVTPAEAREFAMLILTAADVAEQAHARMTATLAEGGAK